MYAQVNAEDSRTDGPADSPGSAEGDAEDTLHVRSSDPSAPDVPVTLRGTGRALTFRVVPPPTGE